jgi:hypothetical protein
MILMTKNQKGVNQILWMTMLGAACFAGGLLVLYILSVFFGSLGFLGI